MIHIEERLAKKTVGKHSLFVFFDYTPKIVEILKSAGNFAYYKDTHEWEFPLNKLSFLIDALTYEDDISLSFMEDDNTIGLSQVIEHKVKPFDYQKDGIDFMLNNSNCLLLDAPGLGKTLQVIYTAEELKKQKGVEHCLIICGINTLKQNWKKEIQKFSTESCRIVGEKVNSKGNTTYASVKDRAEELYNKNDNFFMIINIESLRDSLVLDAIMNSKNKFDMIVLDECHKMKNPNSDQGKALLKLAKVGKYHYGLTGTVLVNSPLDAYAPLRFVNQEKACFSKFKEFYCNISQAYGHYQIDGFKNLDILKSTIDGCSLRRTKDILNLPPKVIVDEYVEVDAAQMKFYNDIEAGAVEEADRVNIKTTSLLGLVTRLRQAATSPETLSTTAVKNTKLERCVDLVESIVSNGEKVIIFSTFKDPLNKLAEELKAYKPLLCTGDIPDVEISESIDKFQNEDYKVILCTTSKMGTGITLTAASYEIFLDSNWTFALEEQCEDRAYRVGTKKSVTIYKLIAKGTIDERIQKILNRKRAISDYIVDDVMNDNVIELRELLGI